MNWRARRSPNNEGAQYSKGQGGTMQAYTVHTEPFSSLGSWAEPWPDPGLSGLFLYLSNDRFEDSEHTTELDSVQEKLMPFALKPPTSSFFM